MVRSLAFVLVASCGGCLASVDSLEEPGAPETRPEVVGDLGAGEVPDEPEGEPEGPEEPEADASVYELDVVMVQNAGEGVNADDVAAKLEAANLVWEQAGIRFRLADRVFETFDSTPRFADWSAFPVVDHPAIPLYIVQDIVGAGGHGGMARSGDDVCEPMTVARYLGSWGVYSHEMGHLLAGGHVEDEENVMWPELNDNEILSEEQVERARVKARLYVDDCGFGRRVGN